MSETEGEIIMELYNTQDKILSIKEEIKKNKEKLTKYELEFQMIQDNLKRFQERRFHEMKLKFTNNTYGLICTNYSEKNQYIELNSMRGDVEIKETFLSFDFQNIKLEIHIVVKVFDKQEPNFSMDIKVIYDDGSMKFKKVEQMMLNSMLEVRKIVEFFADITDVLVEIFSNLSKFKNIWNSTRPFFHESFEKH
jgi:hypothetical protein